MSPSLWDADIATVASVGDTTFAHQSIILESMYFGMSNVNTHNAM
jgi:hypothetical protein